MNRRILIVGDVILDEAVELQKGITSAEGLPTYYEIGRYVHAGGAANVAKHCARLGASVTLVHSGPPVTFGDDLSHSEALRIAQVWDDSCYLPVKRRYYHEGKKVFKVNSDDLLTPIMFDEDFEDLIHRHNVVLACDNLAGSFNDSNRQALVWVAKRAGRQIWVDAQASQLNPSFKGWHSATDIFLNETERDAIGGDIRLFDRFHVKLGRFGSSYFDGVEYHRQHGYPVEAIDSVGAGDAYLAAYAVYNDLKIANGWAALSCKRLSTGLPELSEMENLDAAFAGFGKH